MQIFERRIPLTEGQRDEVGKKIIATGSERLKPAVGEREQLFESFTGAELQETVQEVGIQGI